MKNIVIAWSLPTTRQQGGNLPVDEILHADIELSADAGVSYTAVGGPYIPTVLEVPINDLPFSDQYIARGRAVDTLNQPGNWTEVGFVLADDSPPGDMIVNVAIQ